MKCSSVREEEDEVTGCEMYANCLPGLRFFLANLSRKETKMKKGQTRWSTSRAALPVLVALALGLSAGLAASTPAVVGDWEGALNTGNRSLRVVLHVSEDKEGNLNATLDSPDQGATGIAISTINFKQPDLHFEIQRMGASYDGKINKDNSEIAGQWKQGGASLPLTFKRATKEHRTEFHE